MTSTGPAAAALGSHRLSVENVAETQGSPATWGDLVDRWRQYIAEKRGQHLVFVGDGGENDGEIMTAPYSHRFTQEYTKWQYAKIQGFVRGALSEYTDPHLVFLTFSTSTLKPNGDLRPPIDHLNELLEPWRDGVYYELNQVMSAGRARDDWAPRESWEYLFILEPTTDAGRVPGGYAHAHAAVVVDGEVDSARFESVISRHLIECDGALGDAHEFDDAIVVKSAGELNNPGAYLFKYLGKSWDIEATEEYEKRFSALLFDQERRRFRASDGAQRWMSIDEEESEESWIFSGIADSKQVAELEQYDDVQDFKIDKEGEGGGSLRGWLAQHRGVRIDDEPEPQPQGDELEAGEWYARYKDKLPTSPSAGGSAGTRDRPPPD